MLKVNVAQLVQLVLLALQELKDQLVQMALLVLLEQRDQLVQRDLVDS